MPAASPERHPAAPDIPLKQRTRFPCNSRLRGYARLLWIFTPLRMNYLAGAPIAELRYLSAAQALNETHSMLTSEPSFRQSAETAHCHAAAGHVNLSAEALASVIAVPGKHQAGLLESLLDCIPDIIFYKDLNGTYLGCNPPFAEFVGLPRDQIVGRTDIELFGEVVGGQFRGYDQRMLASGAASHNEEWITYPDGRLVLVDTIKTPFRTSDGDLLGVLGISRDITARKRAEEDLRQTSSRLSLAARAGGVGIWDYDVVNNRLEWDEQMFRLYGITREQFSGAYEAWQAGLHPDDRQRGDIEIQLALQDSKEFDIEFRVLWPDGSTHNIRGFASVERDAAGHPLRMIGTNWDITAQKRAETELGRLSIIQRELMHLATDFVNIATEHQDVAIDESLATIGRIIDADRSYLFIYDFAAGVMCNTHEWCAPGINPEMANLQAVPTALLPDWVAAHRQGQAMHIPSVAALAPESLLRQVLEPQGIVSLITLPLMQGDACLGFVGFDAVRHERVWQQEEVALLRVLAELYAHFLARRGIERESVELHKSLVQARDAAQAGAQAKSRFLASMSHEIRTPLNAVLGYAQILELECGDCPSLARVEGIIRGGNRLLELLTDLLELVRGDSDVVTLNPADFDFYQVLEDVRLINEKHSEADGLKLELLVAADLPRYLYADGGKVRQILVNLVGNAVKFTSSGGVLVSASVQPGPQRPGLVVVVDVEDTGCGISDENLELIFDVFGQAQQGGKGGKGAGLGLPLSRRYARELGGDVTVTSHPDRGSRFRFTFNTRAAGGSAGGESSGPDAPRAGSSGHPASAGLLATAQASLPQEQRVQLAQALDRGDIGRLRELLKVIADEQPLLAASMGQLVNAYDYDRLRALLGVMKGDPL